MTDQELRLRIHTNLEEMLDSCYRLGARSQMSNYVFAMQGLYRGVLGSFPIWLYRYRPGSDLEFETLERGLIYLATPDSFNDPFDVFPVFDLSLIEDRIRKETSVEYLTIELDRLGLDSREKAKALTSMCQNRDSFIKEALASIEKRIGMWRSNTRCACLTTDGDSGYMWENYADNHRGFIAAYHLSPADIDGCYCRARDESRCDARLVGSLLPVRYCGRADLTDYSYELVHALSAGILEQGIEYWLKIAAACSKDEKWQFEKEWRIFAEDCNDINISRYLKLKPSFLVAGKDMEAGASKRLESIANALQIPFRNEANNLV